MIKTFLSVDIAMMKIAKPPDQLCSLGLGSCVGVAVYDPGCENWRTNTYTSAINQRTRSRPFENKIC